MEVKVPQASADVIDHADWIELEAIRSRDGSSSFEELARYIRMSGTTETLSDDDQEDPHDAGGEQSSLIADDAWKEIEDRKNSCGEHYPFDVTGGSISLEDGWDRSAYIFQLLLSWFGLNAVGNGRHPDRDFEHLSAHAAKAYLGGDANAVEVNKFGFPRVDHTALLLPLRIYARR